MTFVQTNLENHELFRSSAKRINLQCIPPSIEQIRAEVAHNPHVTPPSLMKFADCIGVRMDGVGTMESANALFADLRDCTLNQSFAESIRALCLASATKITERFSELKASNADLLREADPAVVRLAQ
jgi:hypothetical protein